MAVTLREQQMIDLQEEGLSPAEIALEMGIKQSSVQRTLSMLTSGLGPDRKHIKATRAGSEVLRLQLCLAGGHR